MAPKLQPLTPHQDPVTLLPKFTTDLPFFYFTKRKELLQAPIDFQSVDSAGRPIRWRVTPNISPNIGAPGIRAHEVWVKLIKPATDNECGRRDGELPSIIPLGSVRHCLRRLGWNIGGWEARHLFRSIEQIHAASCKSDFWIPTTEIDQQGKSLFAHIRGTFSRMSLYAVGSKHVTDDELRNGTVTFDFDLEDTVYVQLHPLEILMQKSQPQRPIDNEYFFSVSPAERRWLELLQPFFFGVTNNRGPGYCEIRYSWYVKHHHTLTRQTERRRVVQQMNELIKDHLAHGYVMRVDYRAVIEPGEEIDFIVRYYPGEGAKESTQRIRKRIGKKRWEEIQLGFRFIDEGGEGKRPAINTPLRVSNKALTFSEEEEQLVKQLLEHGISFDSVETLVKTNAEEVKRQLEYLPFRTIERNKAGLLRRAIEQNWSAPDEYERTKRRKKRSEISAEEARRREAQVEAELRAEEESYRKAEAALNSLSPDEYGNLYEEVKASLLARLPRLKAELESPGEAWKESIRAQMIRRLENKQG